MLIIVLCSLSIVFMVLHLVTICIQVTTVMSGLLCQLRTRGLYTAQHMFVLLDGFSWPSTEIPSRSFTHVTPQHHRYFINISGDDELLCQHDKPCQQQHCFIVLVYYNN